MPPKLKPMMINIFKSLLNLLRFFTLYTLFGALISAALYLPIFFPKYLDFIEFTSDYSFNKQINHFVIVLIATYLFSPPCLRQIVYLFPYKFKNKINTYFLVLLIIFCLVSASIFIYEANELILQSFNPCPDSELHLFTPKDGIQYAILLMILFLLFYILFRYSNKNKIISNLDVLYLRNFSETPDRFILRTIKKALNRKAVFSFVLPPNSMISSWDPYLIAFNGSFFLPFNNLPLLFKEAGDNWKEDIELFIKNARCIIIDGTVMGEGTNWELDIIRKHKAQNKTIILINEKDTNNLDNLSDTKNIIFYNYPPSSFIQRWSGKTKVELKEVIDTILKKAGIEKVISKRRIANIKHSSLVIITVLFLAVLFYKYVTYPTNLEEAVMFNEIEFARKFITEGENATILDRCDKPILFTAIEYKNEKMIELLLQNGANPNVIYTETNWVIRKQTNVLSAAVENENTFAVKLLLENGANPNSSVSTNFLDSDRVLKLAIERGNLDIVDMLLKSGADPNIVDSSITQSTSNIQISIDYNKPEIVKKLLAHGAKVEKKHLEYAKINKRESIARILKKHLLEKK